MIQASRRFAFTTLFAVGVALPMACLATDPLCKNQISPAVTLTDATCIKNCSGMTVNLVPLYTNDQLPVFIDASDCGDSNSNSFVENDRIQCRSLNFTASDTCNQDFAIGITGNIGSKKFTWLDSNKENQAEYRQFFTFAELQKSGGVLLVTVNDTKILLKTNYAIPGWFTIKTIGEQPGYRDILMVAFGLGLVGCAGMLFWLLRRRKTTLYKR